MEELNTPIFAQAKIEYTAQLIDMLYSHMFDGVKSIYEESKLIYSSRSGIPILLVFRELLEKVPIWNSEIIDSECSRIINNSNCDWIDDLITAVFISHTKILTSIGPNQSFEKINITIPRTSTFIHKSYINTARELWKNPYLFNENVPGHEFQKNNKEIENIIRKCIENTIRNLLPIKEILREHLEGETDSILNQKETLKQLLRDELKNIVPKQTIDLDEEYNESDDDLEEVERLSDTNSSPNIITENDIVSIDKKGDLVPRLNDKLEEIVAKENQLMNELNELGSKDENTTSISMAETFPSSDDPTDEQVKKECSDIVVNDITIPVDIPDVPNTQSATLSIPEPSIPELSIPEPSIPELSIPELSIPEPSIPEPVVEIKYDNVDLITSKNETTDQDRLKRLVTNMEVKEEVNVIKSGEMSGEMSKTMNDIPVLIQEPEPKPFFSLNNLYPNMNNNTTSDNLVTNTTSSAQPTPLSDMVTPLQIITEEKPVIIDESKSPRKEIVIVKNEDDIDETSSLAHFFDDMKKIVEEKGIKVEKNDDKSFTLFEDASEVEK